MTARLARVGAAPALMKTRLGASIPRDRAVLGWRDAPTRLSEEHMRAGAYEALESRSTNGAQDA